MSGERGRGGGPRGTRGDSVSPPSDVGELRRQQKHQTVGYLAGGVAHEINNPIQSIMNFAQLIKSRSDSPQLHDYADEILHESQRVATIVRNLMQFARADDAEAPVEADMGEVVHRAVALVHTLMRKEDIAIDVVVPGALPAVECRVQNIQQVLMNLLTCARIALNDRYPLPHEDKRVRIEVSRSERDGHSWVRTRVQDSGSGLELRDEGLALPISREIVAEHGGHFSVETDGEVTRFVVDLPALQ